MAELNKEVLFKPADLFKNSLKDKYHMAAGQYYDHLAKEAKVDIANNAFLVNEYNKASDKLSQAQKELTKLRSKKGGLLFLTIFFFILATILIGVGIYLTVSTSNFAFLAMPGGALVLIALGILFINIIVKKIKPQIADQASVVSKLEKAKQEALSKCYDSMRALNSMLDWNMPAIVMERCTPIIDLDPVFSVERFEYLKQKFGINVCKDENSSLIGVLSGNIQGNPFILARVFNCSYHGKTYHGELTIHWVTTHRDAKGNTYTVTHTQTLHAEAVHDAPFYGGITKLIYGNEAAPHLTFSRTPSGASGLNEKQLEKKVKQGVKDIQKKADEAIKKGKQFTPLGNDEFDVLFGGLNRDNEVEFRLLFTPLAQNNELDLIKGGSPYGDDFTFMKSKMVNTIVSSHSQSFDYTANPERFIHYDFKTAKDLFVSYCDDFISHLYFDLAPLMSVPLYQMHKTHEYIYDKKFINSNVSLAEQEIMSNGMNKSCFMPKDADPSLPLLLKAKMNQMRGKSDLVNIHAYSYHTTPMVDYIPKLGGDGRWHNVPVHWIKYDRVDSDNTMVVKPVESTRHEYTSKYAEGIKNLLKRGRDGAHYERGLFGMFLESGYSSNVDEEISSIFEKK